MKKSQLGYRSGKELHYIVGIVYEILHVVPTGTVTSDLNKFTTSSSRRGTTIREAGVRLLGVTESSLQELVRVRHNFYHDGVKD